MKIFFLLFLIMININIFSQQSEKGNTAFPMFYNYALQGNCTKALSYLEEIPDSTLSPEQLKTKQKFLNRFKFFTDEFTYNTQDKAVLDLIEIYRSFWKEVLLMQSEPDMAEKNLQKIVSDYIYTSHFAALNEDKQKVYDDFSNYVSKFLESKGVSSATGKTAGIYDLLLWQSENHRDYDVTLPEGHVTVKVVFMNDVVTMGWEDYATLGRYYPGGWATDKELYCVGTAYDTTSENFRVSYLQHEGQHFSDYKIFPQLTGPDLEYRAKLVELSYADTTLCNTIYFFIKNSNYDRNNPHAFGNFCVIRDISKKLFGKTEENIDEWKKISVSQIQTAAKELLLKNSKDLKLAGADKVSEFIK